MAEAAPTPSFNELMSRLRGGPRNWLIVVSHFVLSLDLLIANTLSTHDRALSITNRMEPLLTAFEDGPAGRCRRSGPTGRRRPSGGRRLA